MYIVVTRIYGILSGMFWLILKACWKLFTDSENAVARQKTLGKPKLDKLNSILYEWFKLKQSEGVPLSGPMQIGIMQVMYISKFTTVYNCYHYRKLQKYSTLENYYVNIFSNNISTGKCSCNWHILIFGTA